MTIVTLWFVDHHSSLKFCIIAILFFGTRNDHTRTTRWSLRYDILYLEQNSISCKLHLKMFNCCSNKLHTTNIANTRQNMEHNETTAQPLQPEAALFKSLIEVGTNQSFYNWGLCFFCHWTRAHILGGVYAMGWPVYSELALEETVQMWTEGAGVPSYPSPS